MSAIMSACCCDDSATCCDCSLASAYSLAASFGWTTDSPDGPGGTTQTMTVGAGFSAMTMTQTSPACVSGQYPPFTGSSFAVTRYAPPTTAAASFVATSSGSCTSRSATNEAGTWSGAYSGIGSGNGLSCWHEVNAASPAVDHYFWTIGAYFESTATCTVGFNTWPLWAWRFFAYSTPQATCHAPPSSGWTADVPSSGTAAGNSRILSVLWANNNSAAYCNTTAINQCSISSFGSSTFTAPSVTIS